MWRNDVKTNRKQSLLALTILVVVGIVFFLYWGNQKEVWFCDEIYTYESSNGFEQQWPATYTNIWMTGEDVEDFFSADSDSLSLKAISDRLYNDHVPLYFWLFRILSFFLFKGSGTIWIGLTLNLFFYLMVLVVGYQVFERLTGKPIMSAVAMVLTSVVNRLMLQQATTLRMYMMLLWAEMFLILGGLWILKSLNKKKMSIWIFAYLYMVSVIGLLTHYHYWVFYAVTAASFCIWLIILGLKASGVKGFWKAKEFRYVLAWIGNFVAALMTTIVLFPYCRWNLNRGKGQTALHSMFDFSAKKLEQIIWGFERLSATFWGERIPYMFGLFIIFACIIGGAIILYKQNAKKKVLGVILTVVSCLGYQVIVCFTMPDVWEERYLWGGFSIIAWCFAYCTIVLIEFICSLIKTDKTRKICSNLICLLLSAVVLFCQVSIIDNGKGIVYLINEEKNVVLLEENKDIPWVVYGPTGGVYSYYDWLMAEKICFMSEDQSDESVTALLELQDEEKFILYCFEEYVPIVTELFENKLNINITCEYLTQSTNLKVYVCTITE